MNDRLRIGLVMIALSALSCVSVSDLAETEGVITLLAEDIARTTLILDTHIDVPYRMKRRPEDISRRTQHGDFDFERASAGGLNAAFMAIYVPAELQEVGDPKGYADDLIDLVEGFQAKWPDEFVLAHSSEEVVSNFGTGRVALPLGMENGAALNQDLANLEYFYDRGIRSITLVHSKANQICDSSYDPERKWDGLSPFGREVVKEMNRLGMMVDVSHVSDEAFFQIVEMSQVPVIASHSSCRFFTPGWERNLSDEMIQLLAERGGVIQINFGAPFLNDQYRKSSFRIWEILKEKGIDEDSEEAAAEVVRLRQELPHPQVTVEDVVAHIDHVVSLVGIDHVGLGSDFDGVGPNLPDGLKDVSDYPNLIKALLKAGYSKPDIEKICSGNLLRVWREVEQFASSIRE